MGPYAGVDYNLTLCPPQSRLQHIYHGQPYAKLDVNPMPESFLSPSQGLWIWPLYIGIETTRVDLKISSFHPAATGTYFLA
jgi:hypothetical protein